MDVAMDTDMDLGMDCVCGVCGACVWRWWWWWWWSSSSSSSSSWWGIPAEISAGARSPPHVRAHAINLVAHRVLVSRREHRERPAMANGEGSA
eukprot:6211379-Prymnesium_polylepis.2